MSSFGSDSVANFVRDYIQRSPAIAADLSAALDPKSTTKKTEAAVNKARASQKSAIVKLEKQYAKASPEDRPKLEEVRALLLPFPLLCPLR